MRDHLRHVPVPARSTRETILEPAKMRVDRVALEKTRAGIHPPSPGTLALQHEWGPKARRAFLQPPLDVKLSCACFSGAFPPSRRSGRSALPPKRHPRVVLTFVEAALAASRGPIGIGAQFAEMPPTFRQRAVSHDFCVG